MIKVRSITNKKEVIEVPENHYYDVLVRSRTWELVPEEKKICQQTLINASETVDESEPLTSVEPSTSTIASLVVSPIVEMSKQKRKPGRPKVNKEE